MTPQAPDDTSVTDQQSRDVQPALQHQPQKREVEHQGPIFRLAVLTVSSCLIRVPMSWMQEPLGELEPCLANSSPHSTAPPAYSITQLHPGIPRHFPLFLYPGATGRSPGPATCVALLAVLDRVACHANPSLCLTLREDREVLEDTQPWA